MRNRVDIDSSHSRAIVREIGERLQGASKNDAFSTWSTANFGLVPDFIEDRRSDVAPICVAAHICCLPPAFFAAAGGLRPQAAASRLANLNE